MVLFISVIYQLLLYLYIPLLWLYYFLFASEYTHPRWLAILTGRPLVGPPSLKISGDLGGEDRDGA